MKNDYFELIKEVSNEEIQMQNLWLCI